MKLRFVKCLYWYDGPMIELYLDDDTCELWLTTPIDEMIEKCIARKIEPGTVFDDDLNYIKGFFDYEDDKNTGLFYTFNNSEATIEREYGLTLDFLFVEAKPWEFGDEPST